ncbi:MAG: uracil-DNA glycosylase [Bacteroidales bacterium]|jgi:uracil-DNA glycosylase|nr:uracil-DNA glycosylase [Bacteroidales bacterium]
MYKIDKLINDNWKPLFSGLRKQTWFPRLMHEVAARRKVSTVFPNENLVFRAFHRLSPDQVKVVILGQDPYHGAGQAHGLAFSVPHGVKIPPSLRNIFKELENDLGISPPSHGCLEAWEAQGVLLLNTVLTVEEGKPGSHQRLGWEHFTQDVILYLCNLKQPMVFFLWGNQARQWKEIIPVNNNTLILEAPHPSPFSAHTGFFGCRHFSKANEFLASWNMPTIDWCLKDLA